MSKNPMPMCAAALPTVQAAFQAVPRAIQERIKALYVLSNSENVSCLILPLPDTLPDMVLSLTCAGCWLEQESEYSDEGVGIPCKPHPRITGLDAMVVALRLNATSARAEQLAYLWRAHELLGTLPAGTQLGGVPLHLLRRVVTRQLFIELHGAVAMRPTLQQLYDAILQYLQRHTAYRNTADPPDPYLPWVS